MKNWKYFELIATLYKSYFIYIEQGDPAEHAIARMENDFWFYPDEENKPAPKDLQSFGKAKLEIDDTDKTDTKKDIIKSEYRRIANPVELRYL